MHKKSLILPLLFLLAGCQKINPNDPSKNNDVPENPRPNIEVDPNGGSTQENIEEKETRTEHEHDYEYDILSYDGTTITAKGTCKTCQDIKEVTSQVGEIFKVETIEYVLASTKKDCSVADKKSIFEGFFVKNGISYLDYFDVECCMYDQYNNEGLVRLGVKSGPGILELHFTEYVVKVEVTAGQFINDYQSGPVSDTSSKIKIQDYTSEILNYTKEQNYRGTFSYSFPSPSKECTISGVREGTGYSDRVNLYSIKISYLVEVV